MRADPSIDLAIRIMDEFAERSGISSDRAPVRYLWTDAFAVCNYVGLHRATGEERFLALARALVDQVHAVLGRHRPDDTRRGWISGLSEEEGRTHPTAGGLRIGKPLPERAPSEPFVASEEWDRDGQYYHYLTKWTFALNRVGRVVGDPTYQRWAIELAKAAHAAFFGRTPVGGGLHWKMSIDLSRPLVPSTGHHDPLDGLITTSVLVATRMDSVRAADLTSELAELEGLCTGRRWSTTDPLGLGGVLVDTLRCAQLARAGHPTGPSFFPVLLQDTLLSLQQLSGFPFLQTRPERRLGFRELGLALGLRAVEWLERVGWMSAADPSQAPALARDLEAVARYEPVGQSIVEFWSRRASRIAPTWTEHLDISEVMWATCLVPGGFLEL